MKSRGKLFHSLDPAALKVRPPTVTSRVLDTSSWKELADRVVVCLECRYRRSSTRYFGARLWSDLLIRVANLNWTYSETRSQWTLASVLVMWSERRSPATERAAALSTDCRRRLKLFGVNSWIRQWTPDCWSGDRKCTGPDGATTDSWN